MKIPTFLHIFSVLGILSSLAAPQLYGDAPASRSTKKYSYSGKLIIPRPNTIYSDSSEIMREDRRVSAHLAVGLLAYEAALGYYLDPLHLIEAKYLVQKDYFSGEMKLANISLLHFFADTYYVRAGWSWRWGSPAKIITIIDEQKQQGLYDNGIDLGVGTRWQWETISLGVEWLGVYSPLLNREEQTGPSLQLRLAMVQFGLST